MTLDQQSYTHPVLALLGSQIEIGSWGFREISIMFPTFKVLKLGTLTYE